MKVMEENEANSVLERIIAQGIFDDSNIQFIGVFMDDENPGKYKIEAGVNNLNRVSGNSPNFDIVTRDRFKIKSLLNNEILIENVLEELPKVDFIESPQFYGLASKRDASTFGGIANYYTSDDCQGTLGAFFKQYNSDATYFISNWHVLVDEEVQLGSPIIQPRDCDDLYLRDEIGKLHSYYLDDDMDVAIGILNEGISIKNGNSSMINGFDTPKWGMMLVKQGVGTRGYATAGAAKIISVNCSVRVLHESYPKQEQVFHHQIMTQDMAAPKDSGSISRDQSTGKAIGLIFADNGHKYTMHNPIWKILGDKKPSYRMLEGANKGKIMPELHFNFFL